MKTVAPGLFGDNEYDECKVMALQTEQQADRTYCRQASREPVDENWTLANAITPDRPGNKRRLEREQWRG